MNKYIDVPGGQRQNNAKRYQNLLSRINDIVKLHGNPPDVFILVV